MGIKAALPKYELYLYSTVLGLAMIWAASWISEVSSCEYKKKHKRHKQIIMRALGVEACSRDPGQVSWHAKTILPGSLVLYRVSYSH